MRLSGYWYGAPTLPSFIYSKREYNHSKDYFEKLTTEIARRFPGYGHVFEDLDKAGIVNGSRSHNREISKTGWKTIIKRLSDKAVVGDTIDPKHTSQQCPRCGLRNTPGQGTYTCSRCGLKMNRHIVAAINIYLRFKDLKPSPETFAELTRNIGDRPNIVIELRPKSPAVQKVLNKYQRLLESYSNVQSRLDVGSFPITSV